MLYFSVYPGSPSESYRNEESFIAMVDSFDLSLFSDISDVENDLRAELLTPGKLQV